MNGFRRSGLVCVFLLAFGLIGCADDDNNIGAGPSPTQPIAPAPSAGVFTLTGTVSESEPTTSTRLEGARVVLTGDITATTNAAGEFQFTNVVAGTHTLRASLNGYEDDEITITLPAAAGTVLRFELQPEEDTVNEVFEDRLSQDSPLCGSDPCKRYDFGVHHTGEVTAMLEWDSSDADFDLQLICDHEVIASGEGESNITEALTAEVESGQSCEIRVVHADGPPNRFSVTIQRPN